jgi:hypothetical protein
MGSWKILSFYTAFLTILAFGSLEARDRQMTIVYDRGLLSVSLENAELQKVLEIVAEKTGIFVKSPEDLEESVTIQFDRLPLEKGVHQILKDISHVLVFSPSDKKDEPEILSGIFILAEKMKSTGAPRIAPSATLRSKSREEPEENQEREEMLPGETESGDDEEEEDPILLRYESQLDRLEERLDMIEDEESPQGKAIMSQMERLRQQIEKRLQELEQRESQ